MNKHYTFHDGKLTEHPHWKSVVKVTGTFFYSPDDTPLDVWGVFTGEFSWDALPIDQIPKEFRIQLLLMGVPC